MDGDTPRMYGAVMDTHSDTKTRSGSIPPTPANFPVTAGDKPQTKGNAMLRAKVRVNSVTPATTTSGEHVSLGAVYSSDPNSENAKWAGATPCLGLSMTIENPGAQGQLKEGQEFFLDLTPVEAALAEAPATN